MFSLVPAPVQEGKKQFSLIMIRVLPPTAHKSHESAVQLNRILILPQLNNPFSYMVINDEEVEGDLKVAFGKLAKEIYGVAYEVVKW